MIFYVLSQFFLLPAMVHNLKDFFPFRMEQIWILLMNVN